MIFISLRLIAVFDVGLRGAWAIDSDRDKAGHSWPVGVPAGKAVPC